LTKLHHATFDAHLVGIDPDFRIHVSDRLLDIHDGPFLELGLKGIAGALIDRPRRLEDRPIGTGWQSDSSNSGELHSFDQKTADGSAFRSVGCRRANAVSSSVRKRS
jgi:hypothetical protein